MEIILAIDGGGSRTRCLAIDRDGHVVGEGTGGPANHLLVEAAVVARSLRDLRLHGLRPEELEAARLIALRDARAANDVPENAAFQYGHATVRGQPCPDEIADMLPSITANEVVDLAREIFRTKNVLFAVAAPRDGDDQRAAWQLLETSLGA